MSAPWDRLPSEGLTASWAAIGHLVEERIADGGLEVVGSHLVLDWSRWPGEWCLDLEVNTGRDAARDGGQHCLGSLTALPCAPLSKTAYAGHSVLVVCHTCTCC